jgi:hypothetical protein
MPTPEDLRKAALYFGFSVRTEVERYLIKNDIQEARIFLLRTVDRKATFENLDMEDAIKVYKLLGY